MLDWGLLWVRICHPLYLSIIQGEVLTELASQKLKSSPQILASGLALACAFALLCAGCESNKKAYVVGNCLQRVDGNAILKVTRVEGGEAWVKNLSQNANAASVAQAEAKANGQYEGDSEDLRETPAPKDNFVEVPCPS